MILYIGGIKSGKSRNAEQKALSLSPNAKPYYLATSEAFDEEMKEKIQRHKKERFEQFITVEEPLHLYNTIEKLDGVILVECVSMWINNMLHYKQRDIQQQIQKILSLDKEIVFVLNDVGSGLIATDPLSREFVNLSGEIGQMIARQADEVYHVVAGIAVQIK